MEGKAVIVLSVLVMSLVLAQIQVEAKSCCPSQRSRDSFDICLFNGSPEGICAFYYECQFTADGEGCPKDLPYDNPKNSGDAVNKYCKLGCASSVCGDALTTLKNSDASKVVNGAVEQCIKTCSTLCSKGSIAKVKSA